MHALEGLPASINTTCQAIITHARSWAARYWEAAGILHKCQPRFSGKELLQLWFKRRSRHLELLLHHGWMNLPCVVLMKQKGFSAYGLMQPTLPCLTSLPSRHLQQCVSFFRIALGVSLVCCRIFVESRGEADLPPPANCGLGLWMEIVKHGMDESKLFTFMNAADHNLVCGSRQHYMVSCIAPDMQMKRISQIFCFCSDSLELMTSIINTKLYFR